MWERIGVTSVREFATLVCLIALVALTPAGREATQPWAVFIYRTLLLSLVALYLSSRDRSNLRRVCPYFAWIVLAAVASMLLSMTRLPASLVEAFYSLYENLFFAAAFLALAHASPQRPTRWKQVVLIAVVLISIGWMGAAMLTDSRPLKGPFVNPNYLASFVLPALAVCAATAGFGKGRGLRLASAAAGAFLYFGILQTSSRGVTLAGAALVGVAAIRVARSSAISWKRIGLGTAATLTAATIVITAASPMVVGKFLDRGERDPYNYQRVEIWRETLSMIGHNPVRGVGIGNYFHAAKHYIPPVEGAIARYLKWPNIAHSEYLQYIAEIGIPGAFFIFSACAYLMWLTKRRAEKAENAVWADRWLQESALLAAAGIGLHALVDNNWTVPVLASGMAVIAQADLLPYREGPRWISWNSPLWRWALALILIAVWLDSAVITGIGFYFNEAGHAAFLAGDLESAERDHRFALGFLPRHPVLLDNLGQVYLAKYQQTAAPDLLDLAEFAFADAMRENPAFDLPPAHMEFVLVQKLTGDPVRDVPIHKRIIENNRLALAANPFSPFIRRNLAEGLYNIGERGEASAELMKAIEIEPHYVAGYLRLAEWTAQSGHAEEAAQYRNRAIAVVQQFKDRHNLDPYEDLMLGRPPATQ